MNARTIINLLRLYVLENKTALLQFVIIVFISAVILTPFIGVPFHNIIFVIYMILIAGRFFQKTKAGEGIRYYTIPASSAEKLLSAVIMMYSFWLVSTVLIVIGTWISQFLINPLIYISSVDLGLMPCIEMQINQLGKLSLIIAIFLFGSVYFKRKPIGFTFVSIVLFALATSIILGVGTTWIFAFYFDMIQGRTGMNISSYDLHFLSEYSDAILAVGYIISIAFFYTLTYFKLRETEV